MNKYTFAVAAFILACGALIARAPAPATAEAELDTIAPFHLMLDARGLADQTVRGAV